MKVNLLKRGELNRHVMKFTFIVPTLIQSTTTTQLE